MIPKIVPAYKLDEIEQTMLNTFNNNNLSQNNKKELNIIEVDTSYINPNNILENIINYEKDYNPEYKNMNYDDVEDGLGHKYDNFIADDDDIKEDINNCYFIYNMGNEDLGIKLLMNNFNRYLNEFGINYDNISLKINNNIYRISNSDIEIENEVEEVNILNNNKNNNPQPIDDDSFIDFKHKMLNYKLLKLLDKNKKVKNEKPPAIESDFYIKRKNNVIDIRNKNNKLLLEYKRMNKELDLVQKEIEDLEKVLSIYNKLKENNKLELINDGGHELQELFIKLDNDKINEYKTMNNIGKKIIDDKIDNNQIKKLLNNYNPDRLNRIIIKCKRIYILSNYVNISNIAISRISHFLRDTKENIFNLLIEYLKTNPINL